MVRDQVLWPERTQALAVVPFVTSNDTFTPPLTLASNVATVPVFGQTGQQHRPVQSLAYTSQQAT